MGYILLVPVPGHEDEGLRSVTSDAVAEHGHDGVGADDQGREGRS